MVSSSQQTHRIRTAKKTSKGKKGKRARRKRGTPKFPINPAG